MAGPVNGAGQTDGYTKIDTIDLPGGVGGHGDIVAYDTDTDTVWLSQSPDNNEIVIDPNTNTVEATIPNIGDANGVAFSPKYAFVADVTNDTLDVIDKRTFAVVDRVPVSGTTPDGVAYIPSTKQVTVASDDANTLDFIDAKAPFTQTSTTQLVPNPSPPGPDVQTYSPQTDRIYQPDDQDIDVINPHTGAITKTFTVLSSGNVKPPVYDPVSNDLIVGTTNNELLVVNATKGTVLDTIPINGPVDEGVIDAATRTAFFASNVGAVYAVNLDTDTLAGTIPTQAGTHTLTVDPTNNDLYVYEGDSNTVDVFAQDQVPCFVSGTRIRAMRDGTPIDVAVEALEVGDLVLTTAGRCRPVVWLGHRQVECRSHPRPHEVLPVRVSADAFGPARPARDLFLSPGHAICVEMLGEVLCPASALVNGATVRRHDVERVTYWHVELDAHDVILAENLPCESYLEMGNRGFFADGAVVTLTACPDVAGTHAGFCRPFHADGPVIAFVRERLMAHAVALRWTLRPDPYADLHLLADGRRLEPHCDGLRARFLVPAGTTEAWLCSDTGVPSTAGVGTDLRRLGVCVGAFVVDDGFSSHRVPADDPRFDDPRLGYHAAEPGPQRWTSGRARLPASLWADCRESFFLRVDLARPALPRWVEAEEDRPVQARQA